MRKFIIASTATAAMIGAGLIGLAQAAPADYQMECAPRLIASTPLRPPVCGTIRVIAGMAMDGMVPVGISVAMPNVAVMVGAALTAGMDGVPT